LTVFRIDPSAKYVLWRGRPSSDFAQYVQCLVNPDFVVIDETAVFVRIGKINRNLLNGYDVRGAEQLLDRKKSMRCFIPA
jgi:hypothetical protein